MPNIDFAAGWMAGAAVTFVLHPLDTVKVYAQAAHLQTPEAAQRIFKQGGIRGFYKGFAAPCIGIGFGRALNMLVYGGLMAHFTRRQQDLEMAIRMSEREYLHKIGRLRALPNITTARNTPHQSEESETDSRNFFDRLMPKVKRALGWNATEGLRDQFGGNDEPFRPEDEKASILQSFNVNPEDMSSTMQNEGNLPMHVNALCAASGGVAFATVMTPFELVKIRLQTAEYRGRDYHSPGHCLKQMFESGGFQKLYLGYGATIVRDLPATVIMFGAYGIIKRIMPQPTNPESPVQQWVTDVFSGGLAYSLMWILIFPLDTIKTEVQSAPSGAHLDWMHATRNLYAKRGVVGFYGGLLPAVYVAFWRGAIFFGVFETSLRVLRGINEDR